MTLQKSKISQKKKELIMFVLTGHYWLCLQRFGVNVFVVYGEPTRANNLYLYTGCIFGIIVNIKLIQMLCYFNKIFFETTLIKHNRYTIEKINIRILFIIHYDRFNAILNRIHFVAKIHPANSFRGICKYEMSEN